MSEKTLWLLRHAKAKTGLPGQNDHDRPLSQRGRRSAKALAEHLAKAKPQPALVLVSSALRTCQTWEGLKAAFAAETPTRFERQLYLASAKALLKVLQGCDENESAVLLIAHNPGLEVLAERLAGPGSSGAAKARMALKYPTGGLARFTFDGTWQDLAEGKAKLKSFVVPADLGVRND